MGVREEEKQSERTCMTLASFQIREVSSLKKRALAKMTVTSSINCCTLV